MENLLKYLTKANVAAVLVIVAAIAAYALGELDLNHFIQLVHETLGA